MSTLDHAVPGDAPGPEGCETSHLVELLTNFAPGPTPAYVIFIRKSPNDRAAADLRTSCARAVCGAAHLLEHSEGDGVVVLPFPDIATARAWYESPAYHAARTHRFKGADYRVILTAGFTPC
jgi:hypothetical protein